VSCDLAETLLQLKAFKRPKNAESCSFYFHSGIKNKQKQATNKIVAKYRRRKCSKVF
jgi:hypothetical protein